MKKTCLILIALLGFTATLGNAYVIIYPGVEFYGGDITFTVSNPDGINMTYLEVGDNYLLFDNYNLSISCANPISINVSQYNNKIIAPVQSLLRFNATYTTGLVSFTFNNQNTTSTSSYKLYRDNSLINTYTTVPFTFTYNSWSTHDFDIRTTLYPDPPYNPNNDYIPTLNTFNLTWTNGNHSDTTVLRYKTTGYPSSPTDGTLVQNNTNEYYNFTVTQDAYYKAWSYNNTGHTYSLTGLELPWGTIITNCYNESNPSQSLVYNLEISNQQGTIVYKITGLSGYHYIDMNDIPYGTNTVFVLESTGYKQRIYYKDISLNHLYNLSFYLPPSTTQGEITNDTTGCVLRSYINSINISNSSVDATITLTHTLDEIITVEIYNASLYGTYGGWIMIPESKYTTSTNTVIINQTVLDENTTMARTTYYYMYCPTETISTPLYYLRVIETIETEYTEVDRGVEDAIVTIKRYANTTDTYVDVAALLTDANGYCNVYLLPNILYKVNITKSGYLSSISDYIPAPANQYGQTTEKTFRIIYDEESSNPDLWVEDVHSNITYNFEPKGSRFTTGYTFYYNISSSDCKLEWYRMDVYFYNVSSDTTTLMSTQNESDTCGGSLSYTVPNVPGKYTFKCYYKKEGYPEYEFGETGSIIQFVVQLKLGLVTVPDTVWFLITIVIMIVAMGICIRYFNTGMTTGYIGIGIMGIMLMLKDVTINGFSGWVILGITFLIYTAAVFLWWGR
jgi:hypothetical protein